MMRIRYGLMAGVLAAAALTAGAALAQPDPAQGLVTVDIDGVRGQIAASTGLDAARLPATVMVPVGVAAQLCGVEASALAPGGTDDAAGCKAVATDAGFNAALKQQLAEPQEAAPADVGGAASGSSDEARPKKKELKPFPA